ncbi:MAG: leucine-rich repeat protein, partial [Muribaculaceae bacterium]|nr:leucine-rich repeat protein [Muribaculaceae bacterium]
IYVRVFNALAARYAQIVDLDLSDVTIKGDASTNNAIPSNAFAPTSVSGTSALQSVILPRNLTKICDFAFARCRSLKEISIPASVLYVGQGAFGDCEKLNKIVMEGSNPPGTGSTSPLPNNYKTTGLKLEVPANSESNYEKATWWSEISPEVAKQYYWVKFDDSRVRIATKKNINDPNKIEVSGSNIGQLTLTVPSTFASGADSEAIRRPGIPFRVYDNDRDILSNPAWYVNEQGNYLPTKSELWSGIPVESGGKYLVKIDPTAPSTSLSYACNREIVIVFYYSIGFENLEGAEGVTAEIVELKSDERWNAKMGDFVMHDPNYKLVYREGRDYKVRLTPPSPNINLAVTVENKIMTKCGSNPVYETNSFELLPDYEGLYTIPNLQGDTKVYITGSVSIPEGEPVKADDLAAVSKEEVAEFKELTITGEVTEEQFEAVREKFEAVETIDLSTIENDVLPAQALSGLENLKTVVLPENVTTIGEGAFQGCKNLESVTIPGVSAIGEGAFYGCDNLTSVLLPAAGSGPKTRSGEATGITAESFRGLNPNCLIYLNDVSIPNSEHLNIILNKGTTRVADSDINIDTNYPFNAPASFNLGDYKITFTAHVPGSLNADVDGGWTGLILPFTPTAWEYGVTMPEREGVNAGLVLRTIGEDDSLVEVTPETFQANRPFLAHVVAPYESVPVTFYATANKDPENYDLPFTPSPETMCTEGKKFVLYGSLDGETVMGTTWDINERGDKFVPTDSEKIVPFEAYMMPVGNPGVAEYVIGNHEFWMANPAGAGVSGTNLYRGDKVELTAGTEGATIYYTLDGSNPQDPNGTRAVYSDPLKMEAGADGTMNV